MLILSGSVCIYECEFDMFRAKKVQGFFPRHTRGRAGGSDSFQVNLFYASVDGVCTFCPSLTEACLVVVSSYSPTTHIKTTKTKQTKKTNPRSKSDCL